MALTPSPVSPAPVVKAPAPVGIDYQKEVDALEAIKQSAFGKARSPQPVDQPGKPVEDVAVTDLTPFVDVPLVELLDEATNDKPQKPDRFVDQTPEAVAKVDAVAAVVDLNADLAAQAAKVQAEILLQSQYPRF